jgi:hypothetical protein
MGPECAVPAPRVDKNALYTFNEAGAPLVRCINPECGVRTPVWGVENIRIGHLAPMPNKRFGMRLANGAIDERKVMWVPFVTKGPGCPACRATLDELERTMPPGRSAFLPDGVKR